MGSITDLVGSVMFLVQPAKKIGEPRSGNVRDQSSNPHQTVARISRTSRQCSISIKIGRSKSGACLEAL